MVAIATLAVSLVAKVGDFEKGMNKAMKAAKAFDRDLNKHLGTLAKYGSAAVTAAAGATAFLVKNQLEAVDSASKLARTLGIATEDLAGYQHQADLSGVSLDQLSTAIFRINKSTDDSLKGLDSDQRILQIAETYKSLGDGASKATYLTKIFGKAGLAMGPFFEQGAEGIKAARVEAEKLGLTFTEAEGLGIEAANDAVTKMMRSFDGLARQLAVQVAPAMQLLSDAAVELLTSGSIAGDVVEQAMRKIFNAAANVSASFEGMLVAWNVFTSGVFTIAGGISQALGFIARGANRVRGIWLNDPLLGFEDENAFEAIGAAFLDEAIAKVGDLKVAWKDFTSSASSIAVEGFADKFLGEYRKLRSGMNSQGGAPFEDNAGTDSKKFQAFREVDLSRVVVGGLSQRATETPGEKKIIAEQKKGNGYLLQISRNYPGWVIA